MYYFFQDFFFPSESTFENIFELLLAFAVGLTVISKAWRELAHSKCYLEIDDDFIAWDLPEVQFTTETNSTPLANISKSSIEKIIVVRDDKGYFKHFTITTESKESYTPGLDLINTFKTQIEETLLAKYSSLCTNNPKT